MFDTIDDAVDDPVVASALNRPNLFNALAHHQRRQNARRLSAPTGTVEATS